MTLHFEMAQDNRYIKRDFCSSRSDLISESETKCSVGGLDFFAQMFLAKPLKQKHSGFRLSTSFLAVFLGTPNTPTAFLDKV